MCGGERSRSGWLFQYSLSAFSKLCWASLRVKTLRLDKTCQGQREEEICLERNAKGGLGLALPRGKRGGATFSGLRGDTFFFPSKVILFTLRYFSTWGICFYALLLCHSVKLISAATWSCTACSILLTEATFNIDRRWPTVAVISQQQQHTFMFL